MREIELRLALVCFGGASLAVYMNGVSHEILKLVRASKVYHGLSPADKQNDAIRFEHAQPKRPYNTDTEEHYFELLRAIGEHVDLRVIVDVVSGASAGGINGIFLARALAFDLDFDPLRDMWMHLGDIEELMEEETLAERWSKIYMYPVMWLFGKRIWQDAEPHAEAKRKLSRFVRSRWFEPPFSGARMLDWMVTANKNMGEAKPGHSLMPRGHQLDLFVSLTNFHGQQRFVEMHDPATIAEMQHKVRLHFSHMQGTRSARQSDFDDTNIPGLGFAARATSSFPGAFPPARLEDLKDYLRQRQLSWPHEHDFMRRNFSELNEPAEAIRKMCFIDGGVTNNKPFASALDAVIGRPAHREVDRRIIFVDPRPEEDGEGAKFEKPVPSFFRTILSSLAEIPRDEPILGDLQDIEEQNREARRFETVMKRIEVDVAALIDRILVLEPGKAVSTAMLASWRERAHEQAHAEAGFAYGSYVETKAVELIERLSQFVSNWSRARAQQDKIDLPDPKHDPLVNLTKWAEQEGFVGNALPGNRRAVPFFRQFDIDFRIRRLRFMILRLNKYLQNDQEAAASEKIKALKAHIYESIARYRRRWHPEFYEDTPIGENTSEMMEVLGRKMALEDLDFEEDEMLARGINGLRDEGLRRTLFHAYVGFAFYDVLTLPMTAHSDLLEVDEIRVDRISPHDCAHLHPDLGKGPLMGAQLFNFGAFFSRRARENDYIWGRIHAANRLLDFLLDAVGAPEVTTKIDIDQLRRDLALAIIKSEAPHAQESEELLRELRSTFSNV